ncbi:MAG: hypothetical protein JXB48_15940 [Candidatus Latescibacteria bacterium]|nr:hypothetical protein [Candidatus Latescibacterota bacterium]
MLRRNSYVTLIPKADTFFEGATIKDGVQRMSKMGVVKTARRYCFAYKKSISWCAIKSLHFRRFFEQIVWNMG